MEDREDRGILLFGILAIALLGVVMVYGTVQVIQSRPYTYALMADCGVEHVGIDFKSHFENELYKEQWTNNIGWHNKTLVDTTHIPDVLNLKNVDGIHCKFYIQGDIPYNSLDMLSKGQLK